MILFGIFGLVVLLLTFRLLERIIQKLSFILVGGAGAGIVITLVVFNLLHWSGHPDGATIPQLTIPVNEFSGGKSAPFLGPLAIMTQRVGSPHHSCINFYQLPFSTDARVMIMNTDSTVANHGDWSEY